MKDPMATYLHDHLAGAASAIDLLEAMSDRFRGEALGDFAASLLQEIVADRDTLARLAESFGTSSSKLKEGAAWLGEKVSRFKLNHSDGTGLGTFEALEFLQLGIHGKLALWTALGEVAADDRRLAGVDFGSLARSAERQEASVQERRLAFARQALRGDRESVARPLPID